MINKTIIPNGAKYFYSGILQIYFVFIPAEKDTTGMYSWESNGISEENIENITKSILHQLLLIIIYYQT